MSRSLAALLSGTAALLFETLWFRQAALAFGNSVWAASLVLASFMTGLGLGSGLVARWGPRLRRPARLYAAAEVTIGASGLALVLLLPLLAPLLAPIFRPLADWPLALNGLRFTLSSLLMAGPAVAMGATLPLLVKAAVEGEHDFGAALGRLYGWNTLGAVVGALAGEGVLIHALGLRGTGFVAALLNLGAAAVIVAGARRATAAHSEPPAALPFRPGRAGLRILAGAALCGGALLAFEVVWFRFMMLFVQGTSLAFSVMLAVVLAGIALGGFAAARLLSRWPEAHRSAPGLALAASAVSIAAYALFARVAALAPLHPSELLPVAALSLALFFPGSFLSGVLFTFLGRALEDSVGEAARTAGALTLANTLGAAAGSLLAALVLLPRLGLERSFFFLALAYAATGLVLWPLAGPRSPWRTLARAGGLASAVALALFPFGLMEQRYIGQVIGRFSGDGSRLIAQVEGLSESILYFQKDLLGRPLSQRLVTNNYSMSGTDWSSRRYMALFAHLPLALQEAPRRALLICYGVGATARSLVAHPELTSIDVVDVSREVLALGRSTTPKGERSPLDDPRVHEHVEDGRFFLQTTDERFDLITGEPPPPKYAGIVNLYTREYFQLVRGRLSERGLATYWLPVWLLEADDARAITRAFCDAFADCSLWTGSGLNWMLVGSRGGVPPAPEATLARPWREPALATELQSLGLTGPADLGATFLGDATFLAQWTGAVPPLVDDRPARLSPRVPDHDVVDPEFARVTDAVGARERFAASAWVRHVWPASLREPTLQAFAAQQALNRVLVPGGTWYAKLGEAWSLSASPLAPLVAFGSDPDQLRIVDAATGEANSMTEYHLAARDLARRDAAAAERRLAQVQAWNPGLERIAQLRALALCESGRAADAARVAAPWRQPTGDGGFWTWLDARCSG